MKSYNVVECVKERALDLITSLEQEFETDVISMAGPILPGWEQVFRTELHRLHGDGAGDEDRAIVVILDTDGGVIEVAERIAHDLRALYTTVSFLVPNRAMSAGTVLAMSGDEIFMDYHSRLGPIDPQLQLHDGSLVPGLSYLAQFERLTAKDNLSTAELALLDKLDLAVLHAIELANRLSRSLLVEWLTRYKFKDWETTETRQLPVTAEMREERAADIAAKLTDQDRWNSHGRGIDLNVLRDELGLKIEDYGTRTTLQEKVWAYYLLMSDHMHRHSLQNFIHTRLFF